MRRAGPEGLAALRSLFELKDVKGSAPVALYFGPKAPAGQEGRWIKTIPGKGWFTYFRLYGPTQPYFDRSWVLPDIEELKKSGSGGRGAALEGEEGFKLQGVINDAFKPTQPIAYLAPDDKKS